MKSLSAKQRQAERRAARNLGLDGQFEALWESQVATLGRESELARLPVAAAGFLQDGSGNLLFMADLSVVDGGDVIA